MVQTFHADRCHRRFSPASCWVVEILRGEYMVFRLRAPAQCRFIIPNFFLSAAVGLCALTAIIRALRSDASLGNYFVDMWRVVMYLFLPVAFVFSLGVLQQGSPMTFQSTPEVSTLEPAAMGTADSGQAQPQTIVVGALAPLVPPKMF